MVDDDLDVGQTRHHGGHEHHCVLAVLVEVLGDDSGCFVQEDRVALASAEVHARAARQACHYPCGYWHCRHWSVWIVRATLRENRPSRRVAHPEPR